MTPKDNFIHICNLTTTVMGLRKGSLAFKTRKLDIQIPRMVAAVIGRIEEHISHSIIAEVLSRHRASIYHYEKCHQSNYSWEKYRDIFNKVYMAYKQIEQSKKVFIDRYYMKEFLLKNGVKEAVNSNVLLKVKSDKVECVIKTSYFDFSNQLENIKLALKNYHFTVNII